MSLHLLYAKNTLRCKAGHHPRLFKRLTIHRKSSDNKQKMRASSWSPNRVFTIISIAKIWYWCLSLAFCKPQTATQKDEIVGPASAVCWTSDREEDCFMQGIKGRMKLVRAKRILCYSSRKKQFAKEGHGKLGSCSTKFWNNLVNLQ